MFWDKVEKRMTVEEMGNYTWTSNSAIIDDELKESTYFKCIKILSESIAKVPMILMQSTNDGDRKATEHYLYDICKNRANPFMSSIDFFKALEATRQHKGESSALIARDIKGKVTGLYPITVRKIIIDDVGLAKTKKKNPILVYYTCGIDQKEYNCAYSDVLHLKSFTLDGMSSISVKDNLKDTINTNKSSQSYQKDLFSNGLTNKAVVQIVSDIHEEKELKKIQEKFQRLYSSQGRIFTVPAGYSVTPLNLSLADSQFAELKKMGAIDIATSLGVPPYMLGFVEGYNNNSLEQSSLAFLVNTLLILFESIEAELNYKLLSEAERLKGYFFKFNVGVLLRTDAKTQAEIITSYIQNSVYTPNEGRELLGYAKKPDGDELIASSGVYKLSQIGSLIKQNNNQG